MNKESFTHLILRSLASQFSSFLVVLLSLQVLANIDTGTIMKTTHGTVKHYFWTLFPFLSCGCLGGVQDRVGCGPGQPDLVGSIPAHGRVVELDNL